MSTRIHESKLHRALQAKKNRASLNRPPCYTQTEKHPETQ